MRVGCLKFINGRMFFDKLNSNAIDQATITSCNTEFRNNKRHLTNIRSPDATLGEKEEPLSVRDTITLATARTPRSHKSVPESVAMKSRASSNNMSYHAANPNP
jgi:hypothetical protein